MRTRRALWLAPIAVLGPSVPGHATVYLTPAQAQEAIFPGARMTAADVSLSDAQAEAITSASGMRVRNRDVKVWKVEGGGWLIIDEVLGKHEFITYAVGLNADGSVEQIEIMDYRETYGYQVRNADWRAQFVGKTSQSKLQLEEDITNISGATLSSRHITDGVRRLLAFHDIALR